MGSLATKYRPNNFNDVVGQDITKDILKQQIENKSLNSAIGLFGASGTGKTTIAKIIANEINEFKGHPIELDAASHNSVDDVRSIIEQASQRSLESEFKVFIIDECHAITSQGWQSFLKLLEEPNKYTKFIFCTTNPEKIPQTVLSRLQTFTFSKINDIDIINRLKYICNCENSIIDNDALKYIVRLSNGSVRQSIANLEKCMINTGGQIDLNTVINIIGTSSFELMSDLIISIHSKDVKKCISIIETVYNSGKDLKLFIFELLRYIIDLNKIKIFNDFSVTNLLELDHNINALNVIKNNSEILNNVLDFYENNKIQSEIRFLFEGYIIKWCS